MSKDQKYLENLPTLTELGFSQESILIAKMFRIFGKEDHLPQLTPEIEERLEAEGKSGWEEYEEILEQIEARIKEMGITKGYMLPSPEEIIDNS